MLSNLRKVAPSVLKQCRTLPAAQSRPPARTLATSSVLRESSQVTPVWFRTAQRANTPWGYLVDAFKENNKAKPATPEAIWRERENTEVKRLPKPNDAYSGRSVTVINHDVSFALTKLKGILAVNAVRQTNVRDERHEKKGEKRNRLKSQRWRRRFAHEVRKKVQLVNEIRARGA
ncbi:hypothetical protein BV20DRAFT_1048810 [Pilatotrama ljubarskyi]|nr:hypothetical protein BV20DRAFT_1048810 [Pilatotrama ljubarskyi]